MQTASTARIVFPLSAVADAAFCEKNTADFIGHSPAGLWFSSALCRLVSHIEKSPTGRALLRAALLRDISVGLDPLLDAQTSFYYPLQNRLDLGHQPAALQMSEKGCSQYLASFTGGLRRVWQQSRGLVPMTDLKPEDFLRYCRAFEADICAATHAVAWELRAAGPCFFWRHLLADADADIAAAFSRTAVSHPRHQFDGTALRAAFLQWFQAEERVAISDHQALDMMDIALFSGKDGGAKIGQLSLDTRRLQELGALPQGGNYLSGMRFRNPQMKRMVDPFNRTHLRHIQRDVNYLFDNSQII
ncbi:MAG: hypothetical protein RBS08_09455 [Bdellovibrionales bacterium]|jgi:hypothetical protein|nr:hypothetical protein [Bdellovibrionales bacterium]